MTDRAHTAAERLAAARTHEPAQPAARVKDIRSSLDLSPARHRALRAREIELADELGAVRGIRQPLLAAMVAVYLTDEAFARRVNAELARNLRT
jgi:hypothetical protein